MTTCEAHTSATSAAQPYTSLAETASAAKPGETAVAARAGEAAVATDSAAQPAVPPGASAEQPGPEQLPILPAVATDSAAQPAAVSNSSQPQVAVLESARMHIERMVASDGRFVYEGRWYAGVAARMPVFLPPENFFIPQPQLWTQCACERGCVRCVYDGEKFCEGCHAAALTIADGIALPHPCDCEPGCCGLPGSSDGSESEASGSANVRTRL